jgi:aminoglycoside phosphotransferase
MCSGCFPETVGYDAVGRRWLIDAVLGTPLSECLTLQNCKLAIAGLARLQVSVARENYMGPREKQRDFRLSTFATSLEADFDKLQQVFRGRLGGAGITINKSVLNSLSSSLHDATNAAIPDSFVHCDAAAPNIFLEGTQLRLIDLDLAGWGFPFLALETFVRSEDILLRPSWVRELRDAYCSPWLDCVSERKLSVAARVAPIVRVWMRLRWLMSSSFEYDPEEYWHPGMQDYLFTGFARRLIKLTSKDRT